MFNLDLIKLAAVAAAILGAFFYCNKLGSDRVMAQWTAATLEAERAADKDRLRKQEIITQNDAKYQAKSTKKLVIAKANLEKVDQYAPSSAPPLPGTFRVWHDAAATGEDLDDPSGTHAASVSLKEASTTIAGNYADCNADKFRLEALQEIVRVLAGGQQGNGDGKR